MKWTIDGFSRRVQAEPVEAGTRNLMGFVDGTVNVDFTDGGQMNDVVWVGGDNGHFAWAAAAAVIQVVRIIRMCVEFWDRTRLREQQDLIGRQKANGAPSTATSRPTSPTSPPIPTARSRLSTPTLLGQPRHGRDRGPAHLPEGLQLLEGSTIRPARSGPGLRLVPTQYRRQFMPIQERLAGEPLEEYIVAQGGGFFFAAPGVPEAGRFLGQDLLA